MLRSQADYSRNAISFGIQVLVASGAYEPANGDGPDKGKVAGIAIGALTFVVVVHMFSRRGGILINNAFAVVKVMLLLSIVGLGIAKAAGAFPAKEKAPLENFTKDVFVTNRTDPTSWSNSLILCMYTYSGFEQPFYVSPPSCRIISSCSRVVRSSQRRRAHENTSPNTPS